MKKMLRYGLFGLGALFLLVAATLAYIFFMFDPNSLKPQIEKLVTQKTERQLRLQGQIKLRLWPSVGATIDQASWSEYRSAAPFVELGHIEINLAFWPLLRQHYVVQQLDIDGLKGTLIRRLDGSLSIADLIRAKDKPATEPSGPVEFAVDKIQIRNAALVFDDRQQKRISSISELEVSADDISSSGLETLQVSARLSNSAPALNVKLALKAKELRLPAGQPATVRDLQLEGNGDLPSSVKLQKLMLNSALVGIDVNGPITIEDLTLQLDANAPQGSVKDLTLQLKRAALNSKTLSATLQEVKASGQGSSTQGQLKAMSIELAGAQLQMKGDSTLDSLVLHAEGDTPDLKGLIIDLKTSAVGNAESRSAAVKGLILGVKGQRQKQSFALNLKSAQADWVAEHLNSPHIAAHATLKAPDQSADLHLQLEGLRTDLVKLISLRQLKAQGKIQQGRDAANFTLNSPVKASLQPLQFDLPALTLDARLSTPKVKSGSAILKVSGRASGNIAEEKVSTRLNGRFDNSQGHVEAAINGFKKPAINFDIALDQINLDHYLSNAAPALSQKQGASPASFDLSPLAGLQLDGKLAIGSLQKDKLQAKKLAVALKAGNGLLNVSSLAVQAFEGSLTGSLTATTTASPTFTVKQNLSGVNINQVLTTFADFEKLRGRGNAVVDITATGNTLDLLKKTARGSINARVTDGAWKGINVGKTLRETKSMLSGGLQTRQSTTNEETDFSEMTAMIKLAEGIASNDDLAAKSPLLRIGGKGQANLVNSTLDYQVQASIVGSSLGQGGREVDQLKGLTIPIRIRGSFDKPTYSLDYSALLKESTKAKLAEQKKQLEDRAKQEIDDAKASAQQKLDQQKLKATDKLQNELQKGLGRLFGSKPKPAEVKPPEPKPAEPKPPATKP